MSTACPLCSSSNIKTLEKISLGDLGQFYKEDTKVDVSKYFSGKTEITLKRCIDCDLKFFYPLITGDPSFYEELQTLDGRSEDDKTEYQFVKSFITPNTSVLEIECGQGAFSALLPESVKYTGLELNDQAISKGRSKGLSILKESVQSHLATTDQRYDFVCSFQVLARIAEPATFVASCVRLLKPGGTLILSVSSEDSFLTLAHNNVRNMPPNRVLRWTDLALQNLVKQFKLSLTRIWHQPVSPHIQIWHDLLISYLWFIDMGLLKRGCSEGRYSLRIKFIAWLASKEKIRKWLLSYAEKRFPYFDNGDIVVLIAQKP